MPKDSPVQRRSAIDPTVAELLGTMESKADERSLSVGDRRRRKKEREKARARNRVMLDLPQEIEERIKALAVKHECPISQIAALLIWQGLQDLENGLLNPSAYKKPSRSPRYMWNLDFMEKLQNGKH
jgi:hypothetical protein